MPSLTTSVGSSGLDPPTGGRSADALFFCRRASSSAMTGSSGIFPLPALFCLSDAGCRRERLASATSFSRSGKSSWMLRGSPFARWAWIKLAMLLRWMRKDASSSCRICTSSLIKAFSALFSAAFSVRTAGISTILKRPASFSTLLTAYMMVLSSSLRASATRSLIHFSNSSSDSSAISQRSLLLNASGTKLMIGGFR